jgi:HAD superfamily hydrolase (TIGR01509 family)
MRLPRDLSAVDAVVFDLDGTLIHAGHDFGWIKRTLGLRADMPLMEAVASRPEAEQARIWPEIEAWERRHGELATPDPSAPALLDGLARRGVRLGVLTRNTRETALRTLEVTGLAGWFDPAHVLGRHDAPPKPDPAGLARLLSGWGAPATRAVMVGDAPHDTDTGARIGAWTVGIDPGDRGFRDVDLLVPALGGLVAHWGL